MSKDESITKDPSRNSKLLRVDLSSMERALFLAGTYFIVDVISNPLDVAKTRLQAQAAGFPYGGLSGNMMLQRRSFKLSACESIGTQPKCSPDRMHYRGTLDVLYKVIRQEGFLRLWRGTNANLALAIPSVMGIDMILQGIFRNRMEELTSHNAPIMTPYVPLLAGPLARVIKDIAFYPVELTRTRMMAFKHIQVDVKPPGVWKTLIGIASPVNSSNSFQAFQRYRMLWSGLGVSFVRNIHFYAVCFTSLTPLRRKFLRSVVNESNRVSASSFHGANFCAGLVAGSLAAAATSPLDVARTRHQIEKDPTRALNMTIRRTLIEIWRDGGVSGLFAGAGPRVARAGISVGMLVALSQYYQVLKLTPTSVSLCFRLS